MASFVSSVASSNEPRVPRSVRLSLLCLSWTQLGAAFVVVLGRPLSRARPSTDGREFPGIVTVSSRSSSPRRCQRASVAVAAACATVRNDARHSLAKESAVWDATSAARHEEHDEQLFRQLCREAGVVPGDVLRLDTSSTTTSTSLSPTDGSFESSSNEEETRTTEFDRGVRGVYLNRGVRSGDVIVSIPVRSCLRDDEPPVWYDCAATAALSLPPLQDDDDDEDNETRPCMIAGSYNPSDWATRLAASLLHEQLSRQVPRRWGHEPDDETQVTDLWLQLLPDPDWLRASLPVHWPAPVLRSACCASLELAVDAAFFSRAQAAQDLEDALMRSRNSPWGAVLRDMTTEQLHRMCENALDVVQTRSCRVSLDLSSAPIGDPDVAQQTVARDVATPIRLLAPVFDMINHSKRPNAEFFVQYGDDDGTSGGGHLVVRAVRDLRPGDQVLIDYGASTRPAYRCLASYGFVPAQREAEDDGGAFDSEDDGDDDDVAEVYIDGSRYEVTRTTVPEDIVLAMAASPTSCAFVGTGLTISEAESARLTPDIAIRLATRLSDVAYQLLLNPLHFAADGETDDGNDDEGTELPHDVLSARLAASLRWNQHRILLACALGLRDWAVRGSSG